jgi:hypothetical protein
MVMGLYASQLFALSHTDDPPIKDDVKEMIKKSFDNKLEAFSIQGIEESEDDGRVVYIGTASIANVNGISFEAKMKEVTSQNNTPGLTSIKFEFPNTINAAASILDKLLNTNLNSSLPKGLPTPSLQSFESKFADDGITPKTLSATLGCGDNNWKVLKVDHFSIDNIALNIGIEDLNKPKQKLAIGLEGSSSLDKIEMKVSGNIITDGASSNEVNLIGTLKNISIANIISGFGGPENTDINIPKQLAVLKIEKLEVKVSPTEPSISVNTTTTLGDIELQVKTNDQNKTTLSFGVQTPDVAKLENWIGIQPGSLNPIKGLQLAAYISTSDGKLKSKLPAFKGQSSFKLIRGVNLIGIYDTNRDGLNSVSMEAQIPFINPMEMVLKASLNTNAGIAIGGGGVESIQFEKAYVEIKPSPTDLYTAVGGVISIQLDDEQRTKLSFDGSLKAYPIETQACGEFLFSPESSIGNMWRNPFGMPGIGIGDMGIGPCVDAKFPWLTQVSGTANLMLGSIPDKELNGEATFSIDVLNPTDVVLQAYMNNISIANTVEAFIDVEKVPVAQELSSFITGLSADIIGEEGTTIGNDLAGKAIRSGLEDVMVKVATNNKTFLGKTYKRGIAFKGKTNLFGLKGEVDVELEPESLQFKIFGTVDPIEIKANDFPLFALKGFGTEKPKIDIQISPTIFPSAEINGEVTVLGLTSATKILLNSSELSFRQRGRLFGGGFNAELDVIATDYMDLAKANFLVRGNIDNQIQQELVDELLKFMKAESKKNRENLAAARNGNNDLGAQIANTVLDAAGSVEKGLYIAGEAIITNVLQNSLQLKSMEFESNLNTSGSKTDLELDLLVLGNQIKADVAVDLRTQDVPKLAEQLGNEIIAQLGNISISALTQLEGFFNELFKNYQRPICPPGRNCIVFKNAGAYLANFYVDGKEYAAVPAEQYRQYVVPYGYVGKKSIKVAAYVDVTEQKIFSGSTNGNVDITTKGTALDIQIGPLKTNPYLDYKLYCPMPEIEIQNNYYVEPSYDKLEKAVVLHNKSRKPISVLLEYQGLPPFNSNRLTTPGGKNGGGLFVVSNISPGQFRKISFDKYASPVNITWNGGNRDYDHKGDLSGENVKIEIYGDGTSIKKNMVYHLTGDWNGDGKDNFSLRKGSQLLMDMNGDGQQDRDIVYGDGNSEDEYISGDWNGDGKDNIAVRRGNQFLMDTNFDERHDIEMRFGDGNIEDEYIVGDWDGDGKDNIGVRRGSLFLLDTDFDGKHDLEYRFGNGNNEVEYLVGDWDGDGKDNIAVRRGNQILMDTNSGGNHELEMRFGDGNNEDAYVVGDWDGDGKDNIAVRRGNLFLMDTNFDGKHDMELRLEE